MSRLAAARARVRDRIIETLRQGLVLWRAPSAARGPWHPQVE